MQTQFAGGPDGQKQIHMREREPDIKDSRWTKKEKRQTDMIKKKLIIVKNTDICCVLIP